MEQMVSHLSLFIFRIDVVINYLSDEVELIKCGYDNINYTDKADIDFKGANY